MNEEQLKIMRKEIENAVKKTVNGKLDPESPTFAFKEIYQHMKDTAPIIQDYKNKVAFEERANQLARRVQTWGGFVLTAAAVYTIIKGLKL